MLNRDTPEGMWRQGNSPSLLADDIAETLPEVEIAAQATADMMRPEGLVMEEHQNIPISGLFVNPKFFEAFSYELIRGERDNILNDATSIVISEKLAISLFNSAENALDKSLRWNTRFFDTTFHVSGFN